MSDEITYYDEEDECAMKCPLCDEPFMGNEMDVLCPDCEYIATGDE